MKKNCLLLIAALCMNVFTACAALNAPVGSNPLAPEPAQAMQPVATLAATGTPSPTLTATGTPSPTAIDYGPLPITETAVALEQASIGNERARLQARETAQALDQRDAEQTATWAAPSETAVARGTATAAAWVQATQAARLTESASRDEEAARAVMLQQESVKAGWMPWLYGLGTVVILLLGVLAAAWLRAGYAAKMAERRVYEQGALMPPEQAPEQAQEAARLWVPQDVPVESPGAWVARELPAGVSLEKMRQVAGRYFDFGTFSRALVEKHKILTDGEWDSLIEFATAPGRKFIVARNPGIANSGWSWQPNGQMWLKSFDEAQG